MSIAKIRREIEGLSTEERNFLLQWLFEREQIQWEAEIETEFSVSGAGLKLLAEIDARIQRGEFDPMPGPQP